MLKLDQNYSDYTDETDSEYPEGKAVNASTSESFDGTPLLASFMNNIIGAFQAMYKKAFGSTEGIDGNADTVNNSQFADAVAKYSDDRLATHADKRGENAHGATVAATPGQLAARDEYGNLQVGDAIEDEDAVNLKTAEQMFDDANIKEAAHRDVDTVVTAGSENLPTSGAVNNALNALFPIGFVYQQLPSCPSPIEMNMYGTWVQLKLAGMSLRAEGGDAKPFTAPMLVTVSGTTVTVNVSDSATAESLATLAVGDLLIGGEEYRTVTAISGNIVTIDSAFSGAEITTVLIGQSAGLPNITGHVTYGYPNGWALGVTQSGGAFVASPASGAGTITTGQSTQVMSFNTTFDASKGETKTDKIRKTAEESHVYGKSDRVQVDNLTVRYWKRVR